VNRAFSGGKRQREATRDQKKKAKEERLRHNRDLRARGIDPDVEAFPDGLAPPESLPEVKLEDVVIDVAPRPRRTGFGPTRLFVGGLGTDMTSDQLRAIFSKIGALSEAIVIANRSTGQSRGFGFVTFEDSNVAGEAIKQMNGVEVDGRRLQVNRAEPR
jgi:RNA recognition motif-containing protein